MPLFFWEKTKAIVYQNDIAGKICANPECGWKPLSEFAPARLLGVPVGEIVGMPKNVRNAPQTQRNIERPYLKYVEANKDHIQNLKCSHEQANPERYAEISRKRKETHREEINSKARERRQEDIEHDREMRRNSYDCQAEERRKYSLEYHTSSIQRNLLRRPIVAVLYNIRLRTHTEEEWQELRSFYNFKCLRGGAQEPDIRLTRDQVIPLTQSGSDSIDNVQPVWARCNSTKNNQHIDYR